MSMQRGDLLGANPTWEGASRHGTLVLEDGTMFEGMSFGDDFPRAGEVVFSTGMVGYPESFTDPSFSGQILVLTYPLVGSYGVPDRRYWENDRAHIAGLIVSDYIDFPSHAQSTMNLGTWMRWEHIPALIVKDTRLLAEHIRFNGAMLGKIIFDADIPLYDPNEENLVACVSTREIEVLGSGDLTIVLIDCGAKHNITRCLLARGVRVVIVPWDYDIFAPQVDLPFDGVMVSNGPGNPTRPQQTISTIRKALDRRVPVFGICLGHQLLALAAGGDTYKLKFGHRSQNQPCLLQGTKRCYITTQNHGFAVGELPPDFKPWFVNANDGSNEGIIHSEYPFFSVQFHPEAMPGPVDTEWLFDYFLDRVRGNGG